MMKGVCAAPLGAHGSDESVVDCMAAETKGLV